MIFRRNKTISNPIEREPTSRERIWDFVGGVREAFKFFSFIDFDFASIKCHIEFFHADYRRHSFECGMRLARSKSRTLTISCKRHTGDIHGHRTFSKFNLTFKFVRRYRCDGKGIARHIPHRIDHMAIFYSFIECKNDCFISTLIGILFVLGGCGTDRMLRMGESRQPNDTFYGIMDDNHNEK